MHQVNMLDTLNLHDVICQLPQLKKKKEQTTKASLMIFVFWIALVFSAGQEWF